MRRLLIVMFLTLAGVGAHATEFRAAKVVEAEAYTERQTSGAVIKGNGGIYSIKHDMNRIAVSLDGMKVTAVYEAHWSWSPKVSNVVIGTEVQAKVDKDKLVVLTPEGKTIRARIVRRELQPQPVGDSEATKTQTINSQGNRGKLESTTDTARREQ
jgi:hypothetical protein